jgi:hypothetical protein
MIIDGKIFAEWFAKAKPGDSLTYFTGKDFPVACKKKFAVGNLRDAIWEAAFERGPDGRLLDKNTLHLIQRRVGSKPEGNAVGVFEYIAIKRDGRES